MLESIFVALFFFAPAGIANMWPILAAKTPGLAKLSYPMDFNKTLNGKRIFGDHKTIRGFVAGFFGALAMLAIQVNWYESSAWIRADVAYMDYTAINIWLWAFVFDLGVLGGDALKSFFKRQFDRPPGAAWFPFDQLDYVVGGILTSLLVIRLEPFDYFMIALVWFALHPLATGIGYLLKLKDSPL